jgi:hypothetical protein
MRGRWLTLAVEGGHVTAARKLAKYSRQLAHEAEGGGRKAPDPHAQAWARGELARVRGKGKLARWGHAHVSFVGDSAKEICLGLVGGLLFEWALSLLVPVGAFVLYSWLGGTWLLVPILAGLGVAFVIYYGTSLWSWTPTRPPHTYPTTLAALLVPITGLIARRWYGSAWGMAAAAAIPALIIAVPNVFLAAKDVLAGLVRLTSPLTREELSKLP